MELIGKNNRHWQEFSSVSDCLDFITLGKYIQRESLTSSGANPPGSINPSSSGIHARFLETARMMREGWPEGRDQIEEFVIDIEKRVMGYLPIVEVIRDVQGDWLDMGAFVTGEPECWGQFHDTDYYQERKGGKIIHVVLNIDVTWKPFERGAAGVAIIDALERSGHRVVADAVANTTGRGNRLLETRIRVKNSHEPVQLDKLAFLFAHKDILGRVLFACWERLPLPIRKLYRFDNGYGYVGPVPREDQGDIYVPREAGHKESIQDIANYVLDTLKQNGIAVSEEAK